MTSQQPYLMYTTSFGVVCVAVRVYDVWKFIISGCTWRERGTDVKPRLILYLQTPARKKQPLTRGVSTTPFRIKKKKKKMVSAERRRYLYAQCETMMASSIKYTQLTDALLYSDDLSLSLTADSPSPTQKIPVLGSPLLAPHTR